MGNKALTVYLIRHGKTAGNMEKRYIGARSDEDVTPEGFLELAECKEYLNSECQLGKKIKVFSGSMKRCIQTAKHIFTDKELNVIPELTEIDFGEFEGKNYIQLSDNPKYQAWIDSGGTLPFPGGESREDFSKRSMAVFDKICRTVNDGENIAIVCHGGNIMAIMSALTGEDYYDFQVSNGQGIKIEVEINDKRIDLKSSNRICTGLRP